MNKAPCKIGRTLFSSLFFFQFISTTSIPWSAWPLSVLKQCQMEGAHLAPFPAGHGEGCAFWYQALVANPAVPALTYSSAHRSRWVEKCFIANIVCSKALASQAVLLLPPGEGTGLKRLQCLSPKTADPELQKAPQLTIICCILPPPCSALAWAPSPLITEVAAFCLYSWELSSWLCASFKVIKAFDLLTEIPVPASLVRAMGLHCCQWESFPAVLQSSFPGRGNGSPLLQKGNFKHINSFYCSLATQPHPLCPGLSWSASPMEGRDVCSMCWCSAMWSWPSHPAQSPKQTLGLLGPTEGWCHRPAACWHDSQREHRGLFMGCRKAGAVWEAVAEGGGEEKVLEWPRVLGWGATPQPPAPTVGRRSASGWISFPWGCSEQFCPCFHIGSGWGRNGFILEEFPMTWAAWISQE